jgi:hypothetical protein
MATARVGVFVSVHVTSPRGSVLQYVDSYHDPDDQQERPRCEEQPRESVGQALAPQKANLIMPHGMHLIGERLTRG